MVSALCFWRFDKVSKAAVFDREFVVSPTKVVWPIYIQYRWK